MHHCEIDDVLRKKGLRTTEDRHRLLALFDGTRTWTAAAAQKALGAVDLSTVYRNLRRLVKEGLITAADVAGSEEHFERAAAQHHDHLACTRCTTVECLPCPIPNVTDHTLRLNGLCADCR